MAFFQEGKKLIPSLRESSVILSTELLDFKMDFRPNLELFAKGELSTDFVRERIEPLRDPDREVVEPLLLNLLFSYICDLASIS